MMAELEMIRVGMNQPILGIIYVATLKTYQFFSEHIQFVLPKEAPKTKNYFFSGLATKEKELF